LLQSHNCILIAHYIDDYLLARKTFPDAEVYYSSDAFEFPDIYNQCDFVISPRVHGCGIATSLGIPSINVAHDARGQTTKGFLSKVVDASDLDSITIPNDVTEWSKRLIEHRQNSKKRYVELLVSSDINASLSKIASS